MPKDSRLPLRWSTFESPPRIFFGQSLVVTKQEAKNFRLAAGPWPVLQICL